ncbi:unnamed protein product, partial [Medioppia subpectinata]
MTQKKTSVVKKPLKSPQNKVLSSGTSISKKLPAHGENWPKHGFSGCGGEEQSPIRLVTADATSQELHLNFRNYRKPIRLAFIENNGHTVQIGFSDKFIITVYGSASNNKEYIFSQMHFHWGSYNAVGSEHTIDGYRGPMEIHLVHYNRQYPNFDAALGRDDGIMVLGALYKISSRNNQFMSTVISLVKDVPRYKDKAFILRSFTLRSLLPSRLKPFFTYTGSLTTPPCTQHVLWLVFKNTVNIGGAQISSRNNQFMSTVISLVKDVPRYKDKAFILRSFTLRSLLPSRLKPFFTYTGSLTTPPCTQHVLWLVFKNTVNIGGAQEKQFRKCRSGYNNPKTGLKKTISNNFRPLQATNERQILLSA